MILSDKNATKGELMANLPLPEGVTTQDLECVMIDVPGFDIEEAVGDLWSEDALFYGQIPELKYAQGAVGAEQAHLTLLFGLHPGPKYEYNVLSALHEWDIPDMIISKVDYFPSRVDGEHYVCIYAGIAPSMGLVEGNKRLAELPHTTDFPDYTPHITLAYVKTGVGVDIQEWINRLNSAFAYTMVNASETGSLNLGLDD